MPVLLVVQFLMPLNAHHSLKVVTEYKDDQLPKILDALERMHAHLTAAVVSNDPLFLQASFCP